MAKKKRSKKMGRPKKPKGELLSKQINILCTEGEFEELAAILNDLGEEVDSIRPSYRTLLKVCLNILEERKQRKDFSYKKYL